MKIAIIGGGASGMVTAYLLNKQHQLTVFEKQSILGGNIRTINKNVSGVSIDKGIILDNGVIEFEETNFIYFHRLMKDLKVDLAPVPGTTGLFLSNGNCVFSLFGIKRNYPWWKRCSKYVQSLHTGLQWRSFVQKALKIPTEKQYDYSIGDLLGNKNAHKWMRMLMMYCYSIPYKHIDNIPAVLGIPIATNYWRTARWNRIEGGVYTYIEKILEQFEGKIVIEALISSVQRRNDKVVIRFADGSEHYYDKVVFAIPPDQVLKLLSDPTDDEKRRFGAWRENTAHTIIHTDVSIYKPYSVGYFSEFDVFEKEDGKDAGYNAYLNRLIGLPETHGIPYNLSFNMEDRIDPEKILHIQEHRTPFYTREAMKYRPEIEASNGENNTYHAGAYMGNGLHEGAVTAALSVSKLLGGKTL